MPTDAPTVADLDEKALLSRIFPRLGTPRALLGPGDDAAVIAAEDGRTVISIDTLVQDADFRLLWPSGYRTSGFDVGWKCAAQNLSDINAMGAVPTSLDLVEALHPTAAVCGYPTSVAGELISELEHMDRGPYAGPVGWFDAAGNGEWGIALRGAVIEDPQAVRLFAGCGIVSGSNPAAELEETWSKFRPMLEALGLDRARVLSGQPS